jgi:hypothetical protein
MGNQQVDGIHFDEQDLYASVLKVAEVRLLSAIAAQHKAMVYKVDTTQAFSCMWTWTRICFLELQIGGRKWCQKDTASSFATISM